MGRGAAILRDIRLRYAAAEAEPMRRTVLPCIVLVTHSSAQIHLSQHYLLSSSSSSSSLGFDEDERRHTSRSYTE